MQKLIRHQTFFIFGFFIVYVLNGIILAKSETYRELYGFMPGHQPVPWLIAGTIGSLIISHKSPAIVHNKIIDALGKSVLSIIVAYISLFNASIPALLAYTSFGGPLIK